ncbi:MAG: MerR family transcriptional regulator [Roseburia sp.]|nr:MerR family transcriptional regulator [Roseburia sp.]
MRTVKEVAELTGISVRTLHYYDEIGLFRPTKISEAGYRLYDDKALERLQQILFFREFDMPLKDISAIMENPAFDRNQILCSQRKMLEAKKAHLERLISSIDDILKGENKMDFTVFDKEDIASMYDALVQNMPKEQREKLAGQYGGMEGYEKHFKENAESEQAQKNYAKLVEWYGTKEAVLDAAANPATPQIYAAYQNRLSAVMRKLSEKQGEDVHSFAVKEIIGEYDFVSKQLYQMKDITALMLEMAQEYRSNEKMQEAQDAVYGTGFTVYLADALEAFYQGK